jgi:sugar O-acyltransferase (sialic acid O-acetyltransferase NeuD family)
MSEGRYAIWGSAGHAKVLASLIALRGGTVIALFDNRDVPAAVPGVPIFIGEPGFARWADSVPGITEVSGLVAIGGDRGHDRIAIQRLFATRGLRLPSLVHPHASVCSTARLGAGTQVLAQAVVASDARVGDACIVNHLASVDHECVIGAGVHVAPGATVCGLVTLNDNVMVGAGAVVLPRVTIGENSVIGAGAVVTRDVPPGVVIVGNPAREVRPFTPTES